ncbi:MAG: hypothetical protein J0I77_14635 [Rudaea sp.]|uniref:hypothetical protein n=1 Tax=unclassified Rudaea TaxID=2627037 RepID=UPI0010F73A54|nr:MULTISPECIES: hypothetical protein [unclassified Rudaea]MBN8886955.1 hypothetical protein [Rudaea sp.]MBR0346451.1 hypothetical protein [Rudaea sp.]
MRVFNTIFFHVLVWSFVAVSVPVRAQSCDPNAALSPSNIQQYINACEKASREAKKKIQDKRFDLVELETAAPDGNNMDSTGSRMKDVQSFLGSNFGVAIGVSKALGTHPIDSASVVNGIVRVDDSRTTRPLIAFEAHRYLYSGSTANDTRTFANGPFVSVQTGSDSSSLASFGIGWMFGWSDPVGAGTKSFTADGEQQHSLMGWNLGIGIMLESQSKRLGDGLQANQPLPSGESQIRYKTASGKSVFLIVSRSLF